MRVTLDKENSFITSDGKYDQRKAFIYSGIKAAWCYKKGTTTPENIRETNEENLIRMGMDTFLNDHGTPNEHDYVSIEVTGIPKLLCMILNNEHQYTTCERSLRYTKVLPSDYITNLEVELYNKWYQVFVNIFESKYKDLFLKTNNMNGKLASTNMKKLAQENARQFVSVLTPISIAYTTPWYQWQKIYTFLMDMVNNPTDNLQKLAVPYAKDFCKQLVDNKIIVTTKDAIDIYPNVKEKIKDNREILYKNNKGIKLSLFATNNQFSGINKPNEFGASINYNTNLSLSAIAQEQRHRTSYTEIEEPIDFMFNIPDVIVNTEYEQDYIKDMMSVQKLYPQGQIFNVNIVSSLKNIIDFMGKERACDKAQQEIENWYVNRFIPDIIDGLKEKEEYLEEYMVLKKQYLNKCRCAYPNYTCPNPCGHPRPKRPF